MWQLGLRRGVDFMGRAADTAWPVPGFDTQPSAGRVFKFKAREAEPKVYGRIGNLEVRLARSKHDVRRAQRLRYEVFYEERSAVASRLTQFRRLDEDAFDALCDHLLVVDLDQVEPRRAGSVRLVPKVAGTYRILRQDVAERHGGFYSAAEFDIGPLIARHSPGRRFVEVGRSCVLAPYRNKRTMELLWHGLWTYVREHKIDVMFGCASFEGTDPAAHANALSFLNQHAKAPADWQCRAHPKLYVPMDGVPAQKLDTKLALKCMPPLIKAYLRLGAFTGDGAVIDHQFGTTDVLIILPADRIEPRYFDHYGAPGETVSRVSANI